MGAGSGVGCKAGMSHVPGHAYLGMVFQVGLWMSILACLDGRVSE